MAPDQYWITPDVSIRIRLSRGFGALLKVTPVCVCPNDGRKRDGTGSTVVIVLAIEHKVETSCVATHETIWPIRVS